MRCQEFSGFLVDGGVVLRLFVGHRGTGKSSTLKRIHELDPRARLVDLDQLIEAREGVSIPRIFAERGESYFRNLERELLARLARIAKDDIDDTYVALGAGFSENPPSEAEVIWVRRDSDAQGRVFLDRPLLDPQRDPLDDYLSRFEVRESRYAGWADQVLTLEEGAHLVGGTTAPWFQGTLNLRFASICAEPHHFKRNHCESLVRLVAQGIDRIEVRNDLHSLNQFNSLVRELPPERMLLSLRPGGSWVPSKIPMGMLLDVDQILGPNLRAQANIISFHPESEEVDDQMRVLAAFQAAYPEKVIKFSPLHSHFSQWRVGHAWFKERPSHRVYLPRSVDGRWLWYRLWLKGRTPLNFIREGVSTACDQPTLLQYHYAQRAPDKFFAVLGSPVQHSWSPVFHRSYAGSFFAISLDREAQETDLLPDLAAMGLTAAAVTSPLKRWAFEKSAVSSDAARRFEAANLIDVNPDGSLGRCDLTDCAGIESICFHTGISCHESVLVFGSGALLDALVAYFPNASVIDSRNQQLVRGPLPVAPRALIWAASPSARLAENFGVPISMIVDLNYREDSGARIFALKTGARYFGGELFFQAQAAWQRHAFTNP